MNTEDLQDNKIEILYTWALFITAFAFAYLYYKLKNARIRKIKFPRNRSFVSREKIVVAVQIKDFLVKYSSRPQPQYLPFEIDIQINWITKVFRKMLNSGHYYRPLFSLQKIKQFIFGLKSIENVQLCMYSSLPPLVADALLTKLNISSCFPQNRRKYCDLDNDDDQKHAIQVDQDSRRVIIITPNHEDHFYEDDKYFLILRPKSGDTSYLKDVLRRLKAFLQQNEDINFLHDQLANLKIQFEAEYSDYQI